MTSMVARRGISDSEGSSAARILAVCSLAVVAVVFITVVAGSLGGDSAPEADQPDARSRPQTPRPAQEYYVIKPGDTFDAIAAKVGVPTLQLEQLNPELDTQQLPVTGCIDLVPDGCQALSQPDE